MSQYQSKFWAGICTLALMSACGGGGGYAPAPDATPISPVEPTTAAVITCAEDQKNISGDAFRDASAYLTQPATQVLCAQYLLDAPYGNFSLEQRFVAGLAGALEPTLNEVSRYTMDPEAPMGSRIVYQPPWEDIGTTGNQGELWWGRLGSGQSSRHIAIGQLAWERQAMRLIAAGNPSAAFRMIEGEVSPFSSTREIRYQQIDSTATTYSQGVGRADGFPWPVLPGSVSNATLVVNPVKPISGALTMSIEVDGHTLDRTIPLRSNTGTGSFVRNLTIADYVWSLQAAPSIGSNADCTDQFGRVTELCHFPPEIPGDAKIYMAQVQFFGANAEYAVINYRIAVDSPQEKNTRNNIGDGLIVLRLSN